MTQHGAFERTLTQWLADEAAGGPSEHVVADLLEATSLVRPAPTWLASLRQPAMRWQRRPAAGIPRRRLLLTAALLLLALAAALVAGSRTVDRADSGDWLGFRGGPGRDGRGLVGPIGEPFLHWQVSLPAAVRANLAVVDDLVLVPSDDGVLHALVVGSGAERWSYSTGTSITGPTVSDNTIYFVDGRGMVHGIDLVTGRLRWLRQAGTTSSSGVVAGDGRVYVALSDGQVVALDEATGETKWTTTVGRLPVHTPAFAAGRVYVATDDGLLAALRSSDGEPDWIRDIGRDPTGTPTVAGGIIYLGTTSAVSGGRLRAFDANSGEPLWSAAESLYAPAVSDGLAVSGSVNGVVVAFDPATGAERWRTTSGGPTVGPAIVGSVVYVGDDFGHAVFALDAATGERLWTFPVDERNVCCVAVAKGYVFVGTMAASVYAIGGDGSTDSPSEVSPSSGQTPTLVATSPPATEPPVPEPFIIERVIPGDDLGVDRPQAMAVGPFGDIYISDASNQITRVGPDGAVIGRWGGPGTGPGQFDFVPASSVENLQASIGVAPDGTVYVSDSDNQRVQRFTREGAYLAEFGDLGSEPGQFIIPFDLSADGAGNVYVTDDGLMRLTKFDANGELVWVVDGSAHPALAGHMHSADLDADGRIVVIVDDTGYVVILNDDGTVADSYSAPGCDVTMDAAGRHYVTGCVGGVTVYGPNRTPIAETSDETLRAPQFGPDGQVVALTRDGSLAFLSVAVPD